MGSQNQAEKIVLASGSKGRAQLLAGAGLSFTQEPAALDERKIEQDLRDGNPEVAPQQVALALARAKALHVSNVRADSYVIGADQVLALGDRLFEKPKDMGQARENLLLFRGATHHLLAAICVARNAEVIFEGVHSAALTMRDFSEAFLDRYLAAAGESVLTSVGAYRLEETGVQLFEKIEGDYFTILGLPLLPLLEFFREQNITPR